MSLEALALVAILRSAPNADRARLQAIALDVALAVELGPVPFVGPAAAEAAIVALVAIGKGESGWRPEVGDCRVMGDRGRSAGYWQVMRGQNWMGATREDVCSNPALAAFLGLRAFANHARRARTHLGIFYGYASGSASRPSAAGRAHCHRWERLGRFVGLDVSCWNRAPITFTSGPEAVRAAPGPVTP